MIISHGLPNGFVRHQLLFHRKKIIEVLDTDFGNERPERLARDVCQEAKPILSHVLQSGGDDLELPKHLSHLAWFALHDFSNDVHDVPPYGRARPYGYENGSTLTLPT